MAFQNVPVSLAGESETKICFFQDGGQIIKLKKSITTDRNPVSNRNPPHFSKISTFNITLADYSVLYCTMKNQY
jgi:hypothetical protein